MKNITYLAFCLLFWCWCGFLFWKLERIPSAKNQNRFIFWYVFWTLVVCIALMARILAYVPEVGYENV